ncbi:MAG: hypothetical protein V7L09_17885 [Nostoc sp.]|uniref:hypothetical protein n=1 Tax=Nostoc sp. TaxID=1180 RepID=UPI002FF230AE
MHSRGFDNDAFCAIARTNRLLISIALHGIPLAKYFLIVLFYSLTVSKTAMVRG